MEWRRDERLVGDKRGGGAREQEEECVAAEDRRGTPVGTGVLCLTPALAVQL